MYIWSQVIYVVNSQCEFECERRNEPKKKKHRYFSSTVGPPLSSSSHRCSKWSIPLPLLRARSKWSSPVWAQPRASCILPVFANSWVFPMPDYRSAGRALSWQRHGLITIMMAEILGSHVLWSTIASLLYNWRIVDLCRNQAPNPPEFRCTGELTPIETFPHLTEPVEDEASCLVVNIVLPPEKCTSEQNPYPVMFYIHGGA